MKTKILLLAVALQVSVLGYAQNNFCTQTVLTDDYTNPSLWTQLGSNTQISGGFFNFINTAGAVYDRQYSPSNLPPSNAKYFIANCDFIATGGNGPGHHILTLTSNNSDPVNLDAFGGYAPSNNDAIIVDLSVPFTPGPSDAQIPTNPLNPWQFNLRYKIGTTILKCPQTIDLPALDAWNYIKLERGGIGGNELKLSIFSDAAKTIHLPGSPILWCNLPLDPIDSLNFVTHGVFTGAGYLRVLNGKIDNLEICKATDINLCTTPPPTNFCTDSILADDYSVGIPFPWTKLGNLTQISGSKFRFLNTVGGNYNRHFRSTGLSVTSSKYFITTCDFKATGGNGPGHHILTLTSKNIDPVNFNAGSSYALTNNDAIIVDLTAINPPTSSTSSQNPTSLTNPWQFNLRYKIGTTLVTCPLKINSPALGALNYIKLERGGIGGNELKLSIFTDAAQTIHLPGSPIIWCDLPLDVLKQLKFVTHGVFTAAGGFRRLRGTIDNLNICQGTDIALCENPCEQLIVNAGPDLVTCCAPAGTQLNVSVSGGTPIGIIWSPSTGLNNPNILNPISTITGTYTVTIFNNCDQPFTDVVTITSNGGGDASCCRIGGTALKPSAFPNPFSDNFSITIPEEKIATVVVSNLYGVVFETKINASGTIQLGNNLKQGTYSITIIYADGSKELIHAIKL